MANIVRGFRRIGWVLTVPVAALFVLVLFESTKEFSASNYQATPREDPFQKYGGSIDLEQSGEEVIQIPDVGYAYFSKEVPQDVAAKIVADFNENRKKVPFKLVDETGKPLPPLPPGYTLDPPMRLTFTVHKRVDKLKLTGLVAASIAIPVLVIQGLISVLAWIGRGFKG